MVDNTDLWQDSRFTFGTRHLHYIVGGQKTKKQKKQGVFTGQVSYVARVGSAQGAPTRHNLT